MTIFELAADLPNGFHDAEVRSVHIDYEARTADFAIDVWIGRMREPEHLREIYRPAHLQIAGLKYCAIDIPERTYPFDEAAALTVDVHEATAFHADGAVFSCRFWVNEWNAFIHVSAETASLTWQGDPVNRHP